MSLPSRVKAFAEGLQAEGVLALTAYEDEDGHWHLAAPAASWSVLAKGLRLLAEECDRLQSEALARTLN